jgi:hypothetical protein
MVFALLIHVEGRRVLSLPSLLLWWYVPAAEALDEDEWWSNEPLAGQVSVSVTSTAAL